MKSGTGNRRGRRVASVAGLCAVGVAAAVGLAVWPNPEGVAVAGCDQTIPLSVAVDPAAADALGHIADQYEATHPCRIVNILPWSDALTAASLATNTAPDVWVATGASWENAAREAGVEVESSRTVATSPVVVALPAQAASALGWSGSVTDADLAVVTDRTWKWASVGVPTGGAWRVGLGQDPGGRDALAGYLQNLGTDGVEGAGGQGSFVPGNPWTDASDVASAMAETSAIVTTEQAVTLGDVDHPGLDVVALYLQPPVSVQVQALILPSGRSTDAAADDFVAALAEAEQDTWGSAALRAVDGQDTPDAVAATATLMAGQPTSAEGPNAAALAQAGEIWSATSQPANILLMVDYSGSMTQSFAERADTRQRVLIQALTTAAESARPQDRVTVYSFQSAGGRDSIGEIAPGVLRLEDAVEPMSAKRAAGGTPLYRAIISAVETADSWPGNSRVVIITDGQQDSAGSTTRADVVGALTAKKSSTSVVLVGFGANVNMWDLTEMARTGGATAVHVNSRTNAPVELATALFG